MTSDIPRCKYRTEICCEYSDRNCKQCGHNPEEDKRRKDQIRNELNHGVKNYSLKLKSGDV